MILQYFFNGVGSLEKLLFESIRGHGSADPDDDPVLYHDLRLLEAVKRVQEAGASVHHGSM